LTSWFEKANDYINLFLPFKQNGLTTACLGLLELFLQYELIFHLPDGFIADGSRPSAC
jgi:hypothetical protein